MNIFEELRKRDCDDRSGDCNEGIKEAISSARERLLQRLCKKTITLSYCKDCENCKTINSVLGEKE